MTMVECLGQNYMTLPGRFLVCNQGVFVEVRSEHALEGADHCVFY